MDPSCINPHDGLAHVLHTMQLGVLPPLRSRSTFSSESVTPCTPSSSLSESASASNSLSPEQELEEALAQVALAGDVDYQDSDLESELDSESEDRTETTPYPNIFVVGDVADAFGAIPAGHTAYYQACVVCQP